MAKGDFIPANNTTLRSIRSGNDLGTGWVYFTGTRVRVVKGSTTFGHEVYLELNTGANFPPLWTRVWSTSGADSATFDYTIPFADLESGAKLPSWRIRRADSGLFIGNPDVDIYIQYWVGQTGKKIYYYNYVTGVSSSYINPEYRTHKGTKITDAMKYNMSY